MSFLVDTSHRSSKMEIMDDFTMQGALLRDTLDKLEIINRFLGGNSVTIKGLKKLIKNQSKNKIITIVDLGCGNGDILRDVAKFGRENKYSFNLIGIDANFAAVEYAKELSKKYSELSFKMVNVLSEDFKKQSYDVVLCTLFLHHFKNEEIISLLKTTTENATIGVVVNDLHRHKLAYYFFKLIGFFIKNKMVRQDGLTSILRAFKRKDLENIAKEIKVHFSIQWKWAFRYLWILKKDFID
ncbi:MAG: methyltransferase domain-containing protein [Candidatus Marisimplicoccus sp.]|jgi:2-polyprenyl-3-methyl-5-hydroxy-6-metoxy-1,4-benzoquinol methylase|tara:strand:- start:4734 stop:5456 length:723 start_codon:yes stop_codon:yes gene_type:complete